MNAGVRKILSHDLYRSNQEKSNLIGFMHGILGSKRNWRTPANLWKQMHPDFSCLAIDQRGHGSNDPNYSINSGRKNNLESCAADVIELLDASGLDYPTIVVGHSFSGKVALQYNIELLNRNVAIEKHPQHTWMIDSLPIPYVSTSGSQTKFKVPNLPSHLLASSSTVTSHPHPRLTTHQDESIKLVFQTLGRLPQTNIVTKEWMISELLTSGIDPPVAQWLATSLVPMDAGEKQLRWGFDFDTVRSMFEDFCDMDMWPFLEAYRGPSILHFLRAGRNPGWTPEVVAAFESLATRNPWVRLHTMPQVGHWVHVDDLRGMLDLITQQYERR